MGVGLGSRAELAQAGIEQWLARQKQRISDRLKLGLAHSALRYGLARDLAVEIEQPSAKIPLSVRPMRAEDLETLLPRDVSRLSPQDRLEVGWRRDFVNMVGLDGGFVAIDERDGSPCYMQWLLGAGRNDAIARIGGFPRLEAGQALLENAYTPPTHRGLGIMSAAMAMIAERGSDVGARQVLTFVGEENIASLKGCRRAGFAPVMTHTRRTLGFGVLKSDRFAPLPDADPRRAWEM